MADAKKGDWVQVHQIVLKPEERAPQVPEDTSEVPLELWVKGFIKTEANIGDEVEIITVTSRKVIGRLTAVNPGYTHGYGKFVPELLSIDSMVKEILYGGQ